MYYVIYAYYGDIEKNLRVGTPSPAYYGRIAKSFPAYYR